MLTLRSHPTFSEIYQIIAISGRQTTLLTIVVVKSMSRRLYPVKLLGMWKEIDWPNLRSTVTGA